MSELIIQTGIAVFIVGGALLVLGYHLFRRLSSGPARRRVLPVPPLPEQVMAAVEREVQARLSSHPRAPQLAAASQWGDVVRDVEPAARHGDELVLAYAHYCQGDPGHAMAQLEARLVAEPRDAHSRLLYIRLLQEQEMFCAAEAQRRAGLELQPDHAAMVLLHAIGNGMKLHDDEVPLCDHFARWLRASAANPGTAPQAAAAPVNVLVALRKKLRESEQERARLEERLRRYEQ